MISIVSQKDAILLGALGLLFILLCGGGMLLTLRRSWFKPRYRDVRITGKDHPGQFSLGIVGYLFGIVMGAIFLAKAIFWTPL